MTHESTPYRLANWACLEGHQECHLSSSGATSSMVGLHLWTHGSWEGAPNGGKTNTKHHSGDSVPFFLHETKKRGNIWHLISSQIVQRLLALDFSLCLGWFDLYKAWVKKCLLVERCERCSALKTHVASQPRLSDLQDYKCLPRFPSPFQTLDWDQLASKNPGLHFVMDVAAWFLSLGKHCAYRSGCLQNDDAWMAGLCCTWPWLCGNDVSQRIQLYGWGTDIIRPVGDVQGNKSTHLDVPGS